MDLIIPIKGIYFDQIKSGKKPWEYRLRNEYWRKRLEGRKYDNLVLAFGAWGPQKPEHPNTRFTSLPINRLYPGANND